VSDTLAPVITAPCGSKIVPVIVAVPRLRGVVGRPELTAGDSELVLPGLCDNLPALALDTLSDAVKALAARMPALLLILCNTGADDGL